MQEADVKDAYYQTEVFQQSLINCIRNSVKSLYDGYNKIEADEFKEAEHKYNTDFEMLAKTLAYRMNYQVLNDK